MPFVDLPDDNVSIFYRSNLSGDGSVQRIDRARQTILLLPGTMLDSSDMSQLLDDDRLSSEYNLIALDLRSTGQTRNAPEVSRDAWTDAADIVKVLDCFQLPVVHIFACSSLSVPAAERIALLWPWRCLSITLLAIQADKYPNWVLDSYGELMGTFMSATSLETMEEVINDIFPSTFGDWLSEDQKDIVAQYWETQYCPARSSRLYDFAMCLMKDDPLTPDELASIKVPVLILNGDETVITSPEQAAKLQHQLAGASGGAKLHIIAGAPDQMHYLPRFSHIVIVHLLHFIEHVPDSIGAPPPSTDPMRDALSKLSSLKDDPSIARRDSKLSASFSCVSAATVAERQATLGHLTVAEKTAYTPVGPDGSAPRKFSERYSETAPYAFTHRSRADSGLWALGVEVSVSEEA